MSGDSIILQVGEALFERKTRLNWQLHFLNTSGLLRKQGKGGSSRNEKDHASGAQTQKKLQLAKFKQGEETNHLISQWGERHTGGGERRTGVFKIIEGQETASNGFEYQFTTGKPLKSMKPTLNYVEIASAGSSRKNQLIWYAYVCINARMA